MTFVAAGDRLHVRDAVGAPRLAPDIVGDVYPVAGQRSAWLNGCQAGSDKSMAKRTRRYATCLISNTCLQSLGPPDGGPIAFPLPSAPLPAVVKKLGAVNQGTIMNRPHPRVNKANFPDSRAKS